MRYTVTDFVDINKNKLLNSLGLIFHSYVDFDKYENILYNLKPENKYYKMIKNGKRSYFIQKLILDKKSKDYYPDVYKKIKNKKLFFISDEALEPLVFLGANDINENISYIHKYCFSSMQEAEQYIKSL